MLNLRNITKVIALSTALLLGSSVVTPNFNAVSAESQATKQKVVEAVQKKILERQSRGFAEFNDLNAGKVINMKDTNQKVSKYLVELNDQSKELAGYMIVDEEKDMQVVEFSLGNTHPLKGVNQEVYYLGPITYFVDLGNGKLKDLKTKKEFSKEILDKVRSNKTSDKSEKKSLAYIAGIEHYDYTKISGVPDYQQDDNTNMIDDCVPTSGANVIMYWDTHGYSNMSSSDEWIEVANRLGEIMGHTDGIGVDRSEIVPGMEQYIDEHGYSWNISRDIFPSFSDFDNQIEAGQPLMISSNGWMSQSEGHNVTGVGTESYYDNSKFRWYYYVIVHDNWDTTGEDVWVFWGNEDFDDLYIIDRP